ncbi:MAG: helix-turn-helix transcriptional regulator [Patescibacteria group bacterium]
MKSYPQFKKELLKNPGVRRAYEELGPEFEIIALLIKTRLAKHMSQRELARKIGTQQEAISRFESGRYNPSLSFLYKVASALDARVKISISSK